MADFGDVDPNTGQTSARTQFSGTLDPLAPSVANGQITPAQWAEYQAKRKRDAILGVLGVLGGAMGGSALSYGLGGYGAGAGAANAAGPAFGPGAANTGAWTTSVGAAPVVGAGVGGGAGAGGVGAGAGAAGQAARRYLGLTLPEWLALGGTGLGTIGAMNSERPNMQPDTTTQDPQLQKLLATMQGRLDKSEPLIDSIFSMANGLLPTQYQKGGGGPR